MFTLYKIAFAATGIPHRIGILFTHKSADFGAISATKRSWAAPISKVESHISDEVFILYRVAFRVGTNSYPAHCKLSLDLKAAICGADFFFLILT